VVSSTRRPLYPRRNNVGYLPRKELNVPESCLNAIKRKIISLPGFEPRTVQPTAIHYTDRVRHLPLHEALLRVKELWEAISTALVGKTGNPFEKAAVLSIGCPNCRRCVFCSITLPLTTERFLFLHLPPKPLLSGALCYMSDKLLQPFYTRFLYSRNTGCKAQETGKCI
jgi:hypothetical protein